MEVEKSGRATSAAARLNALIEQQAGQLQNKGYQKLTQQTEAETLNNSNIFFTTSVLGMKAVSHVIEDQVLSMGDKAQLYAGFQRYSRLRSQQQRYEKLLEARVPIYLFGVEDAILPQNPYLHPIALTEPIKSEAVSLSKNWFVVLYNPQFVSMALVTRELPSPERPLNAPDKLVYRNFEGFWTYDKEVIEQVVTILDDYIQEQQAANVASPN